MGEYLPENRMLPTVRLVRRFSLGAESRPTSPRIVTGYETGIYLTDGGELTINGETHALRSYDVRFLRAGDEVSSTPAYTCLSIYFDFGELGVMHDNELLGAIPSFFSGNRDMAHLFERVSAAISKETVGSALELNTAMMELLLSFYSQFHSRESYSTAVMTCIRYMRDNLSRAISLEDLGRLTDYSALHILRLFKRDTQRTPHAYLTALRMAQARQMLTESDCTVAEIAIRCGFESESHFQSLFKTQTGMTPGRYRRRARSMV